DAFRAVDHDSLRAFDLPTDDLHLESTYLLNLAGITRLHFHVNPTTIPRCVWSIWVNAVESALTTRGVRIVAVGKRPCAEGFVTLLPFSAHLDPPTAVDRVPVMTWKQATLPHSNPDPIQAIIAAAVRSL